MKIKIINPVIDVPPIPTDGIEKYLKKYLRQETQLEFDQVKCGFRSIETEAQGIINGAQILDVVQRAQQEDCDGIYIDCFDDPAVIAARELSAKPVVGPYYLSILFALSIGERVSIITTDDYGITSELRKAAAHGLKDRVESIEKVDMTVLELSDQDLASKIVEKCLELEKRGITVAVLGCTGMNYVAEGVQSALMAQGSVIQIVEPLKIGVTYLEYMLSLGYTNTIKSTYIDFNQFEKSGE